MSTVFVAAVWWGAPAWRSRVLARWTRDRAPRAHWAVLTAACATAVAIVAAATVATPGSTRLALAWAGAGAGEGAVAMALFGVRQWRFAPRPRALGAAALVTTAAALVLVVPALVVDGSGWSVALMVASMVVVLATGRVPAARAREAADARAPVPHR